MIVSISKNIKRQRRKILSLKKLPCKSYCYHQRELLWFLASISLKYILNIQGWLLVAKSLLQQCHCIYLLLQFLGTCIKLRFLKTGCLVFSKRFNSQRLFNLKVVNTKYITMNLLYYHQVKIIHCIQTKKNKKLVHTRKENE